MSVAKCMGRFKWQMHLNSKGLLLLCCPLVTCQNLSSGFWRCSSAADVLSDPSRCAGKVALCPDLGVSVMASSEVIKRFSALLYLAQFFLWDWVDVHIKMSFFYSVKSSAHGICTDKSQHWLHIVCCLSLCAHGITSHFVPSEIITALYRSPIQPFKSNALQGQDKVLRTEDIHPFPPTGISAQWHTLNLCW